jgi:D-alanyl-D-alanine carboxypeptidase (penicillin-binding protein 5/6)
MFKWFLSMLLCLQVSPIFHNVELVEYGESAVLMDAYSGQVMYEKDAYKQLHPASMTKMMGMLLIYEGINDAYK